MAQFLQLLREIYTINYLPATELERAVTRLLIKLGFVGYDKKILEKIDKNNLTSSHKFKDKLAFIHQPFTEANSPDFLIIVEDQMFSLECKSTKSSGEPMYNSGSINPNYIYVFSNASRNLSVIYLGSDVITDKQFKQIAKSKEYLNNKYAPKIREILSKDYDPQIQIPDLYFSIRIAVKNSSCKLFFEKEIRKKLILNVFRYAVSTLKRVKKD